MTKPMSHTLQSFHRRARKVGVPADAKTKFLELAGTKMIFTVNGNNRRAAQGEVAWFTRHDEKTQEGLATHYSLERKSGWKQTDDGPVRFTIWTITKDVSLTEDAIIFSAHA